MATPEEEKLQKARRWWSIVTRQSPSLAEKYGTEVPFNQAGKIPSSILNEAKLARQGRQTPLVGTGPLLPEQRRIQAPESVDWTKAGRNMLSGLMKAGLPISAGLKFPDIDPEIMTSALTGQQPRDFSLSEDPSLLERIAQPIAPELGAFEEYRKRIAEPIAGVATEIYRLGCRRRCCFSKGSRIWAGRICTSCIQSSRYTCSGKTWY